MLKSGYFKTREKKQRLDTAQAKEKNMFSFWNLSELNPMFTPKDLSAISSNTGTRLTDDWRWLLAEAVVVQKGLIVSVVTVMWTSQTEASEPQLVRKAAGHLRANRGSADQGLCSRQGDKWWLQSKCQNYKFHSGLTQRSSKVYLHFHIASTLGRQCQGISRQNELGAAVRAF